MTWLLLAMSVLMLPGRPAGQARLQRLFAESGAVGRRHLPIALPDRLSTPARWSAVVGLSLLIGVLVGPAAGAAVGLLGGVGVALLNSMLDRRAARRRGVAMVEALGAVAAELRAGLAPVGALQAAGDAMGGRIGEVFRETASTVAFGGDAPTALLASAGAFGELRRVAAGWRVSVRSGASLGDVLDRVETDLRADLEHRQRIDADLAGARATAGLLATLPILGLGLGGTMGAHPLHVLLHTAAGQLALVVGAGLDALGLWWTSRILRGAEQAA
jgi:tight adherence protein B